MKIRQGFVSNSSSSSFVCSACEAVEVGYDGQYDIDVSQCNNYHEFCSSHIVEFTLEDKQRILLLDQDFMNDLGSEKASFIESGSNELIEDVFNEYKDNIEYEVPESMCPVCTLTSISSNSVLRYLLDQTGQTLKDVEAEIQSKYSSLDEFREGLK